MDKLTLTNNLHEKGNGSIFIQDDRSLLISIAAFGALRKELIENIGNDRMKGFLLRYGWKLGEKDAEKVLKMNLNTVKERILYGPELHKMQGNAAVVVTKLEVKAVCEVSAKYSISMEGIWRNSYEAVQHIAQFGIVKDQNCYTLAGYGSGFLSKICNQTVIFKELTCEVQGYSECRWIAKSLDQWGEEIKEELDFYKDTPIVQELEKTYEQLIEERENLKTSILIHEKLTQEILLGNNLESIANIVYAETGIPGMITDKHHQVLAYKGIPEVDLDELNREFKNYLLKTRRDFAIDKKERLIQNTELVKLDQHSRLVTPIILQDKMIGYCSFVYPENKKIELKIHKMLLERVATISSLFLLNEKTKFGADQRLREHFFEDILRGEYLDENEILRKGNLIHLDLSEAFRIIAVRYQFKEKNLKNELAFHGNVLELTYKYFTEKNIGILITHKANGIVLLIPEKFIMGKDKRVCAEGFLQFLSKNFSEVRFFSGISKASAQIGKVKDSYHEALTALRMTTISNSVVTFESLGIIGPLINQNNEKEVKQIAEHALGPLLKDLDEKKIDLLKTLYTFLSNGGNLEQTALNIGLSLSGLRYRISKIEEMLDKDLRNPIYMHQLLLALQIIILIDGIDLQVSD
ncbi:XylR N-terminal domain-containing protein [Sporosarcina ureilytica]|uniref:4-vinyl reductase 4VR domain-containing protein n=1 Tax=Sporosarcina ureilytica TaxID=298596 RepID=A0A1D8JBY0_9BACL|nr:XylR N-terminal domain-containing protein [Sporosarcina ureilytica]AOV06210.1 hypothetical protein BI350_00190 [Sporosarcina ureilytica]